MPLLTSGEMVGAIAMTEPDAGSDLQGIRTKAKRDGENGDFILNGSKVGFLHFYTTFISLILLKKCLTYECLASKCQIRYKKNLSLYSLNFT